MHTLKKHFVQIALGLALALVFLGHVAEIYVIPLISTLDAFVYDARIRLMAKGGVDERIVILDLDEKSLAEIGRWPWNRKKMAELVNKLFDDYAVALLGFDVIFAEPDDSSGLRSLEDIARRELKDDPGFQTVLGGLRGPLDYDRRFTEALRGRPVVLAYSFDISAHKSGLLPEPAVSDGTFKGKNIVFPSWNGYGANLPEFQRVAASAGFANPVIDSDGILRRVPMLVEHKGKHYESLALAMARVHLGNPLIVPGYPADNPFSSRKASDMEWLDLAMASKSIRIPVDKNVASLIPFRGGAGSFHYVSAADVLTGRIARAQLKGKIVIFGTTTPGLRDLRATPVDKDYPGVEINANMLAGILDASLKGSPAILFGAEVLLSSFCTFLLAVLLPFLSAMRSSLLAFGTLLTVIALNHLLWSGGLVMPLAATITLILTLYVLNMSWGYFAESYSKGKLAELFGQYVPPELVDKMAQDPERYNMEGRNEELTVLFSDVRGFTSISEAMEPKELASLMNVYLDTMTEVIHRHRGTLDKYMGDAIMAFCGAPVADADHAGNAVSMALEMQQALHKLDKQFLQRGWPLLKIGIGINSGTMTVGDMGSRVRRSYTVMGDAVNLGARLEGITKYYQVGIIVSESTRARAGEIAYRELDRVRVKGKETPIAIFEPLGKRAELDKAVAEELQLWELALRLYRNRDWDRSGLHLRALARSNPEYFPYRLYLDRIMHYRATPPDASWDGVTVFETK